MHVHKEGVTHHIVYRAVNPVVLLKQLLHCRWPANSSWNPVRMKRGLTEACFLKADTHLKAALRVLFFLTKAILTKPSHSFQENRHCIDNPHQVSCISTNSSYYPNLTWKLTGGGGFFGSILTTLDSTFGGGRKLFFPTCFRRRHGKLDCSQTGAINFTVKHKIANTVRGPSWGDQLEPAAVC